MLHAQWQRAPGRRRTVGADKAYDVRRLRRADARAGHHAARHAESRAAGRQRDRRAHDAA